MLPFVKQGQHLARAKLKARRDRPTLTNDRRPEGRKVIMRIVLFCHSFVSDWNHGNAHFLRAIVTELKSRGHDVRVYEPKNGWSVSNLLADAGPGTIAGFHLAYPQLTCERLRRSHLDLDAALDGADVVLVHEWNDHEIVKRIGRHRATGGRYVLLFHDTHHRSASDAAAIDGYDLEHYDGILALGEVIRRRYLERGWARRAWTWHEAADTRMFHPTEADERNGDLVWIGNWADAERAAELYEFLIRPVTELRLRTVVFGVRYPPEARQALASAGIEYGGWLPNYHVPHVFSRFRVTVHIPRRPYVEALPGIPTIHMYEALACGIPMVSAWWDDREGLFSPGKDFLMVRNGQEMTKALRRLLHDRAFAETLRTTGLQTISTRHTCGHRVSELLAIVESVRHSTLAEPDSDRAKTRARDPSPGPKAATA
jgi:spore maturation protein CgeB